MDKGKLIRKLEMECPLCGKKHEVDERERLASVVIKGDDVSYRERFYYCENCDEDESEYQTCEQINQNMMNARNEYRLIHGLLTADEIVAIRDRYGLSQVDLARLMGWGEATVSRYESKAIQDEAYDTMLRLIKDNPLAALELLKENSDKFTAAKRNEIRARIIDQLDSHGKEYLARQSLQGEYVDYEEPSDANGYTVLDINKLEAAVSYIAGRVSNLFKVKLMKMLWYADALAYKTNGHSITGLVYMHNEMGALPVGHRKITDLPNITVHEEMSINYDSMLHFYTNDGVNCDILSPEEKNVLDKVIKKFKSYKAQQIVDYMHNEKAYTDTEQGEVISFSLAKDIREF